MSRIGKLPIIVPAEVNVVIDGNKVSVKGPKGSLAGTFNKNMEITLEDGQVRVARPNDAKENRAIHGLTRTLIANMIEGVSSGFKKELEVVGVGYRCSFQDKNLSLTVGYSQPVVIKPPPGIVVEIPAPNKIVVSGYDKQLVGQFAAEVRAVRPPEPYKGKGIKYVDEVIRRKEGKAGKSGK